MRVLLKIPELWVHTASHTEDDFAPVRSDDHLLKTGEWATTKNHFQYQALGTGQERADFTYKIAPDLISITDTGLGSRSVTEDIEAVLRKIEPWHQGSVITFKIMCRDATGFWRGVHWDGKSASFFALQETDQRQACKKLCKEGESEATHSSSR